MARGVRVEWINGVPVHKYVEPYTQAQVVEKISDAWANEYQPKRNREGNLEAGEEQYVGKTCLEVYSDRIAQLAAGGDLQAAKELSDRTLGKPKQTIDTTVVQGTWQDFAAARIAFNEAKGITFDAVEVSESDPELDF